MRKHTSTSMACEGLDLWQGATEHSSSMFTSSRQSASSSSLISLSLLSSVTLARGQSFCMEMEERP